MVHAKCHNTPKASNVQLELYAAVRFQREVLKRDLIFPSGLTFISNGKVYTFGFMQSSYVVNDSQNDTIICACTGIDVNSSDTAEGITKDIFKATEKITGFQIGLCDDAFGHDLKPQMLRSILMIVDGETIMLPDGCLDESSCSVEYRTLLGTTKFEPERRR